MERVEEDQLETLEGKKWYIIHHAVYHKRKNKIRIVFNCSLKYKGISLNDELLSGPILMNSLIGVLLRFREEEIVILGDIEKMFYQVRVPNCDRNFLRLLWFPDGNIEAKPEEYRLCVHVFGATSSPSCSIFALQHAASSQREKFSAEAVETVLYNFYVDDLLKSVNSSSKAVELLQEVRQICSSRGFKLTQIASNSREVLETIPDELKSKELSSLDFRKERLPSETVLGVRWNIESDDFSYSVKIPETEVNFTRRSILSVIYSIFDPLGFIGPALLPVKRILQQLCELHFDWDDMDIPSDIRNSWKKWISEANQLLKISIPRCIKPLEFGDIVTR